MIRILSIVAIVYLVLTKSYSFSKEVLLHKEKEIVPSVELYREYGIKFPEIVYKQSLLETANFTSNICLNNRNYFGMKYNSRGYADCEKNGHACYSSIVYSIRDYAAWQAIMMSNHERLFRKKIISEEDYYFFLERLVIKNSIYSYAEDKDYVKKLKSINK